ncbi:hypothetical protein DAEQUDRAFT_731250 [Daedalea quercina L-15889]|uniref:Uncharacterized protein n=1 Tax=Daedalea quercina L-15889 TaxID=1314783 RepID=A0A165ME18_9APHY|nr:hypothetical protein DAEQUDRAFT_731250 [Daedalea quercina L-15889]
MPSKFLCGTPSLSALLATLRFVKIEADHDMFVISGWRDIGPEEYPDDAALILRTPPKESDLGIFIRAGVD